MLRRLKFTSGMSISKLKTMWFMPSVFFCLKENYLSKFAEAWWNDFKVSVARKLSVEFPWPQPGQCTLSGIHTRFSCCYFSLFFLWFLALTGGSEGLYQTSSGWILCDVLSFSISYWLVLLGMHKKSVPQIAKLLVWLQNINCFVFFSQCQNRCCWNSSSCPMFSSWSPSYLLGAFVFVCGCVRNTVNHVCAV